MKDPVTPPPSVEPTFLCTVLITPTTIGDVTCAAGAQLRLPKPEAEALASLTPPAIRIDGI